MKRKAAEMWCYRRLLNVTYKYRRTNESVLIDLNTKRELFGVIVKRKMSYFGHMSRKKNLNLTKTIVQERKRQTLNCIYRQYEAMVWAFCSESFPVSSRSRWLENVDEEGNACSQRPDRPCCQKIKK